MTTRPKAPSDETNARLATLVDRVNALDTLFACGGELQVPAPVVLRGPKGKRVAVVRREEDSLRPGTVGKKLRAWCAPASFGDGTATRQDARVRAGRQLYARDSALAVEGLDAALEEILSKIRESLLPYDSGPPRAELHSLNVYERGGHFVAHKDTPRDPSVVGTLVVCLPLEFGGGALIVERESRATFDWAWRSYVHDAADDNRIRWAAFFGDVDHRIEPVTSGCRVTLTYELRRAPASKTKAANPPAEADLAFTAALSEVLADSKVMPAGGKLGVPCLHLYAVPTGGGETSELESLHLKGRDFRVAAAAERAGFVPRVVPYVFETCAGDAWRLSRDVTASEKKMFTRKRLEGWDLEEKLPLEARVSFNHPDDVTWLGRPPWSCTYGMPRDGRPEPAVDLLGETEFSETGYFGNEASYVSFYATCAILLDVPPKSARKPRGQGK